MTFTHPDPAFDALEATRLDLLRGADWDPYYAAMAPWLQIPHAYTRSRAVERLCMAVFSVEGRSIGKGRKAEGAQPVKPEDRLAWLLAAVEQAHARFDDVVPAFLKELGRRGLDDPHHTPLLAWLHNLRDAPPPNVSRDVVEGTLVLRESFDEDEASDVKRFVELLDHPSNYVRACAARQLSCIDSPHLTSADAFALIKKKELLRPGIAGPFWTDWHFTREHVPVDAFTWMMDVLENRNGPEPADMQFNGIDFYLHEICDFSPATVRRMIEGGFLDLAIETATEIHGPVPGMEPVLRELADHPDEVVHNRAQVQLALYYRVLHPDAAGGSIRHYPKWSSTCDTFGFSWGQQHVSTVVLYPAEAQAAFNDALAWSLIDRLLPPEIRGALVCGLPGFGDDSAPEPTVFGNHQVLRSYASGASLQLDGDVAAKAWSRITINGGRLGKDWAPFGT